MKYVISLVYLLCSFLQPTAANSWLVELQYIDEIRLKDRNTFHQKLTELQNATSNTDLSPYESGYLDLLIAYEHAYREEFEAALAKLRNIQHSAIKEKHLALNVKALEVNINILSARYLEAFRGIEELLLRSETIDNDVSLYHILGPVLLLYNDIEHFDFVHQLVERILKNSENQTIRCRIQTLKLPGILNGKGYESYIIEYEKITELCDQAGEKIFNLITIRNHLFNLIKYKNNFQEVINLYNQNISSAIETGYPVLIFGFQAAAASAYIKLNDLESARLLLSSAESILPADRFEPTVLEVYRALYEFAVNAGDRNEVIKYSNQLIKAELASSSDKAQRQLAYHLANNDTHLREHRIALLDKDNELLTLERNLYQQQAENRYLLLLLIGSLSLILGLLTYRGLTRSKRYRKMAEFDQLTGISNRYHFTEQAQREIAHCIRAQRPVALILFDLDHFKQINDRFGHAAGDWTLQQVVLSCRNFIRHSDIFGRIGGEEFVILLTDCTAEQAVMLADICRTALADIDTSGYQPKFKVTASFGISDSEQAGYDLSALLAAADAAMYQAKQQGRNQVYCPATADGAV